MNIFLKKKHFFFKINPFILKKRIFFFFFKVFIKDSLLSPYIPMKRKFFSDTRIHIYICIKKNLNHYLILNYFSKNLILGNGLFLRKLKKNKFWKKKFFFFKFIFMKINLNLEKFGSIGEVFFLKNFNISIKLNFFFFLSLQKNFFFVKKKFFCKDKKKKSIKKFLKKKLFAGLH